jgi:hypothetical protein
MPWFEADADNEKWGWHWTMNRVNPNEFESPAQHGVERRRKIAAHYYPEIGPYDSADDAVLEYHLLLMKLAGIDGVIVDWYGRTDHFDYARLHANTMKLVDHTQRLGLKFAICYEDQTIPKLIAGGKLESSAAVEHAAEEIRWLKENWFSSNNYIRIDGLPVLLSFGHAGMTHRQWERLIDSLDFSLHYFSEHHRRKSAVGAFDWPVPDHPEVTETFIRESKNWEHHIPIAYPGFNDFYQQAGVSKSWRQIPRQGGETFRKTLRRALTTEASIMQIATFNDWGEGTMIEPSVEFGFRDLVTVQDLRRELIDRNFQFTAEDLKLPRHLLSLRRAQPAAERKRPNVIAELIAAGKMNAAQKLLAETEQP